jgi:F0F1-type ATP synthase assembly protein I
MCVFCLIGWWLDKNYETAPMWLLIFSITGIIVAMYNFLRTALKKTAKKKIEDTLKGSK